MSIQQVLMDFTDIEKFEKSAEISYSGKRYRINTSVNPRTKKLLVSVFCENKPVLINKVAVEGEPIFYGFGSGDFDTDINVNFVFTTKSENKPKKNYVNFLDLNKRVFLYLIESDSV